MVFGRGPSAGAALVQHKRVPLISFTGGDQRTTPRLVVSRANAVAGQERRPPFTSFAMRRPCSRSYRWSWAARCFECSPARALSSPANSSESKHHFRRLRFGGLSRNNKVVVVFESSLLLVIGCWLFVVLLFKSIFFVIMVSPLMQGEICLCGSRIFVQRGIYDRFVAQFVELCRHAHLYVCARSSTHAYRCSKIVVGDPSLPNTFTGGRPVVLCVAVVGDSRQPFVVDRRARVGSASRQSQILCRVGEAGFVFACCRFVSFRPLTRATLQEGGRVLLGGKVPSVPAGCVVERTASRCVRVV